MTIIVSLLFQVDDYNLFGHSWQTSDPVDDYTCQELCPPVFNDEPISDEFRHEAEMKCQMISTIIEASADAKVSI